MISPQLKGSGYESLSSLYRRGGHFFTKLVSEQLKICTGLKRNTRNGTQGEAT